MNRDHLPLFVCVATVSTLVMAQSNPSPLTLAQGGAYHFEGTCTSMVENRNDETANCLGKMAITTEDADRPNFVFTKSTGIWVFVAEGKPSISNEGKTATYAISRLLDSSAGPVRALHLPGKCVLNAESRPTLSCAIPLQNGRDVHASFDGNGVWAFTRNKK